MASTEVLAKKEDQVKYLILFLRDGGRRFKYNISTVVIKPQTTDLHDRPLPPLSDRWHRTSGRWAPQSMHIAVETAELPLRPHQLPLPTAECNFATVYSIDDIRFTFNNGQEIQA